MRSSDNWGKNFSIVWGISKCRLDYYCFYNLFHVYTLMLFMSVIYSPLICEFILHAGNTVVSLLFCTRFYGMWLKSKYILTIIINRIENWFAYGLHKCSIAKWTGEIDGLRWVSKWNGRSCNYWYNSNTEAKQSGVSKNKHTVTGFWYSTALPLDDVITYNLCVVNYAN